MIETIHSLAFSIQASRGVYAVLLGSGVSSAAKIPTGWAVTLDLIRKLARLYEETCDPDPELWYLNKVGREADYSELLDQLAKTPSDRQQLLRPYWEPNNQEREEGAKQPTKAHRAIAALSAQGFIRVIVTTNVDRLMETALKDEGVEPTILSTLDQVRGALPLIHTRCCVFKVHGDYLDTGMRNTLPELNEYPPEIDSLLDRIFDEFGLIVCGWSAEWDGALRSAISRTPTRRFTTYWAVRGEPGEKARQLISHRGAQVIQIQDADSLFQTVQEYVESIEEFSKPHPLSAELAIASLKRYIPDSRYRIQLADLISQTVEQVVEVTSSERFAVQGGPNPTTESTTARVRSYEAACSTLLSIAPIAGFWAEEEHFDMWRQALLRLGSRRSTSGTVLWLQLQRYPATLLLYALGLGAVGSGRLQFLNRIFKSTIKRESRDDRFAIELLPASCLISHENAMKMLGGMERRHAPLNDWIHDVLWPFVKPIIPDEAQYTFVFDKLEILMALGCCYAKRKHGWPFFPLGSFGYRTQNRKLIFQQIKRSIAEQSIESPFVTCQIFGKAASECIQVLTDLKPESLRFNRW